ncbi:MAG: YicC family protein [Bacteroidetes bacterium 4572_117]|nr:MAG: YicC family protein [Bacteroidetes bacterium 4572_117]
MLKSMTGFGKAVNEFENKKITVEIKTLNSKQADITARIPGSYKEKEMELRNMLAKALKRGKIELSVWIDQNEAEKNIQFNKSVIKNYYQQLVEVTESLNRSVDNEQILEIIMRLPDVTKTEMREINENEWLVIKQTVSNALSEIEKFKLQEGKVMQADFKQRIEQIQNLQLAIEPHEKSRIEKVKDRIKQNFKDNLKEVDADNNRFEQELIYYLEKLDITEEKVRLANHCSYFTQTMNEESAQGKKLGFIAQEIGREINTIGSKANNSDIQKIVVQMKDELEKIKEQVLNVL